MAEILSLKLKRRCCHIGCSKNAEYEIWWGNRGDQYTDSCLEHIPELINLETNVNYVYKIGTRPVYSAELVPEEESP